MLSSQQIARFIPARLLGTSWDAVQSFARLIEAAAHEEAAKACESLAARYDEQRPLDGSRGHAVREAATAIRALTQKENGNAE